MLSYFIEPKTQITESKKYHYTSKMYHHTSSCSCILTTASTTRYWHRTRLTHYSNS